MKLPGGFDIAVQTRRLVDAAERQANALERIAKEGPHSDRWTHPGPCSECGRAFTASGQSRLEGAPDHPGLFRLVCRRTCSWRPRQVEPQIERAARVDA